MTQPSLNQTFDTSLIDTAPAERSVYYHSQLLNQSFSTTESDPSDIGDPASLDDTPRAVAPSTFQPTAAPPSPSPATVPPTSAEAAAAAEAARASSGVVSPPASTMPHRTTDRPLRHLSTTEAYDEWAAVYDTDGNVLQQVDDAELAALLPAFLDGVVGRFLAAYPHAADSPNPSTTTAPSVAPTLRVLDLGCGTGRNTAKLLRAALAFPLPTRTHVVGADASARMLEVAEGKLRPLAAAATAPPSATEGSTGRVALSLARADAFAPGAEVGIPTDGVDGGGDGRFDALISTLVLEHIQLTPFFAAVSALLRPGGRALVTNMHAEMGRRSQAGFVDKDGNKVRGVSYEHGVADSVDVAAREGLRVVGEVREVEVTGDMVEKGAVGERGRKWVGVKIWFGMVLEKVA